MDTNSMSERIVTMFNYTYKYELTISTTDLSDALENTTLTPIWALSHASATNEQVTEDKCIPNAQ